MADLITSARAKYNLNNVTTTTDEDTTIAALVTAISRAIRRYCGREFDSQSFSERHFGTAERHLVLREIPIVSITSVTLDDQILSEADGDFIVDNARGWLYRACGWEAPAYDVQVTYTAGYATVPEDAQEACAQWVAALFYQTKRDPGLIQDSIPGAYHRIPRSTMPAGVADLLRPYRQHRILES